MPTKRQPRPLDDTLASAARAWVPRAAIRDQAKPAADSAMGVVVMWWGFSTGWPWCRGRRCCSSHSWAECWSGILKHPNPVLMLIVASFIIKVVAGGKRRAELTAARPPSGPQPSSSSAPCWKRAWKRCRAQIEPHFLFNTLASSPTSSSRPIPRAPPGCRQSLIRYMRAAMPQMREGSPALSWVSRSISASAFLEIMSVRMEGRLQPVVSVPEGLKSAIFPR